LSERRQQQHSLLPKRFLLLLINLSIFTSKINAQIIRTVAGDGTAAFSGDGGLAVSATLNGPTGVAIDTFGNLYIADNNNHRIRKIDALTKVITTIAGKDSIGYSGDGGLATNAKLNYPTNIAIDKLGNIIFTDYGNKALRKIDITTGIITTISGRGSTYGDGGPAIDAKLNFPIGLAIDTAGNIYISDRSQIRKIDYKTNIITLLKEFSYWVSFYDARGISVNKAGNVFVSFPSDHRIVKITPTGIDSIFAGDGTCCYTGSISGTPALTTRFNIPQNVGIDNNGDIFISEFSGGRIRKVNMSTRLVFDFVGSSGGSGVFGGDEGPAISANLNQPMAIVFDKNNGLYIADYANNRIRYVCKPDISALASDTLNFCINDSIPSPLYPGIGLKWYNTPTGDTGRYYEPKVKTDTPSKLYYFVSQTGASGCESIKTKLFINIYDFPIKPLITKIGMLLSVPNSYSTFQWYLNNTPITGATSNSHFITIDGKYHVKVTNIGGCEALSDTTTYDATTIKRPFLDHYDIKIYPNPTKKYLQIVSKNSIFYQLKTITGKLLLQETKCLSNHELELSNLPDGLYILTLTDATGMLIGIEKISKVSL
jgi:hypothetical protein